MPFGEQGPPSSSRSSLRRHTSCGTPQNGLVRCGCGCGCSCGCGCARCVLRVAREGTSAWYHTSTHIPSCSHIILPGNGFEIAGSSTTVVCARGPRDYRHMSYNTRPPLLSLSLSLPPSLGPTKLAHGEACDCSSGRRLFPIVAVLLAEERGPVKSIESGTLLGLWVERVEDQLG